MIHSSDYKPRIFPIKGTGAPAEIDRAQSIDPSTSLNREKVEEIGRDGAVGYIQSSPTIAYRLTQNEYGNIEFFQKIINTSVKGNTGQDAITLSDFRTPYFDVCAYLTDDNETFRGTMLFPNLRTSGFGINIGEPQAIIERSFDFVGETSKILKNDNKYYIYQDESISGDDTSYVITLDKTATVDPNLANKYMLRVVRVTAGGVSSELSKDSSDYIEDTTTVTVASVTTGDTIKLYYSSASAPDVLFALNDTDPASLLGDSADVFLYIPASGKPSSSDRIARLQSVDLSVTFDREDLREIGNKDIVQRGVTNSTVSVTLGRILEEFTVEEILSGQASSWGIIDVAELSSNVTLIIKIYTDNTKTTLAYGIKAENLSPTELRGGAGVNAYADAENSLEGEDLSITVDNTVLGF